MRKVLILFVASLFLLNVLLSSQVKPERTFTINKCGQKKKISLTLIDSNGDFRFDKAVETFCDNCTITLPVVIRTKYKNDPVPESGDIAVNFDQCKKIEHNTCEKLKIKQGIMPEAEHRHIEELSFVITFFDEYNNVTAIAKQTCGKDTLFITGAMCNIKWDDE
jgi:hypothetical protein